VSGANERENALLSLQVFKARLSRQKGILVSTEATGGSRPAPFVGSEFPEAEFREVCRILLAKRGFDLAMYKDRCVKRRIATRVRARGLSEARPYLALLERDEAELDALMAALTIHVSQFFRNPSTFALLERQVLPELLRRAQAEGRRTLRLWSVGCASGEEPYSLALLMQELAPPEVKIDILGTDISAAILESARAGLYEPQRLAEVPASVRERYFTPEGKGLRLAESIRRLVRFECHNMLTAPVYPRADLIVCRNVLIYFSREEQENILQRFAAALPVGGVLVLGKAEMLLGLSRRLFAAEYAGERIYRRQ
jgi:chemotaxis protein methyltransferase CheR